MASATSVFLIAIPIVLQARSEAQASSLCSEVGGLIVAGLVSPHRPLAETEEAVFEPGDPLFSSLRGRATDVRAVAWPGGAVTFRSCLDSTLCIGAVRGNGVTYLDLSQGRSRALSIGSWRDGVVAGSCKVATGKRAERINRYFSQNGTTPRICRAGLRDFEGAMVSGSPISTLASFDPYGPYLQVHAWRVLPLQGKSKASIGMTEIGIQTLRQKLTDGLPYLFGFRDDYRRNRCSLKPAAHVGVDLTADTYFLPSHPYPPGRYRDGER